MMLLPCGRWNNHMVGMEGRPYCLGGRWNGHWVRYVNLSSLLLIRTSSHKWGRWYLPMFLFRDGLLTLINIDSFLSLERFCSSLPTMLKFSSEVVWPVVLLWSYMGEGAFRCSLYLSPNVLDVTNVLLITFQPITFESVNYTTLFGYVVFIFWCHQFIFQGLPTLKVHLYATFLPIFLKLSLSPLLYGTVMELLLMLLLLLFWLLLLDVFGVLFF